MKEGELGSEVIPQFPESCRSAQNVNYTPAAVQQSPKLAASLKGGAGRGGGHLHAVSASVPVLGQGDSRHFWCHHRERSQAHRDPSGAQRKAGQLGWGESGWRNKREKGQEEEAALEGTEGGRDIRAS